MSLGQCTIRFHQDGPTLLFQIEGCATMSQSLPLRRFVEQSLALTSAALSAGERGRGEGAGPIKKVWVDLRHCTYIDSTFLGTLLFLHRAALRQSGREFRLISPSSQCTCLLQQMGVMGVFPILTMEEGVPPSWTILTKEPEDKQRFQRNVLEAHEELAKLPGAAGEPFRAVVRCLAKDLEKHAD
jgi:anti-sigma B factor antagonist